jgi:DNA polymerase III sliding clamp (beta) subunit (PCNA family)
MRVSKSELELGIAAVSRFVSQRSPAEIYSKLQAFTENGTLHFQCQSNSGVVVVDTTAAVSDDIAFIVDFAKFSGVIGRVNDGDIGISVDGSRVVMRTERSSIELPAFNINSPTISRGGEITSVPIDQWIEASNKMSLAGAETQVEYTCGVRILADGGKMYMLMSASSGTCGFEMDCSDEVDFDVCVPVESVKGIAVAIKKAGGDNLSLGHYNNWVSVESGRIRAALPTIGGKLPRTRAAWEQVKPSNEMVVPRGELIEALRQAELFSEPGACGIDIIPGTDGLRVVRGGVNDEGIMMLESSGGSEYHIPGSFSGDPLIIRLPYMLQMLNSCSDDYRLYASRKAVCVESGRYFAGFSCMTRTSK